MHRIFLALVLVAACAKADGSNALPKAPPSGGIRFTGPAGDVSLAVGDTLSYTISGPSGSGSTSYDFTISSSATNGTWTVRYGGTTQPFQPLPASGNTESGG